MCINISPHTVESSLTGVKRTFSVPCGKCCECVKKRQNDWKLRLLEECNNWNHLFFFTLTYSDDSLPHSDVVNVDTGEFPSTGRKSDVQSWLKCNRERYYRKYGERLEMKYFISLEYAPDGYYIDRHGKTRHSTCRPHYHGLFFFNCDVNRIKPWFTDWANSYGFYKCSEIVPTDSEPDWRVHRSKVCNYVAKYTAKGEFQSRLDDIDAGRICKPFLLCSKNIGLSYVDRMRDYHLAGTHIPTDIVSSMASVSRDFHRDYGHYWFVEVEKIHSVSKVSDGQFQYKMPRYWSDRIYGYCYKQKRYIRGKFNLKIYTGQWDSESIKPFAKWRKEEPLTCYSRVAFVKRYSRENWLSLALQYLVQLRSDSEYKRKLRVIEETIQEDDPIRKSAIACDILSAREARAKMARYESVKGSLYNFYNNARFKTPELMCGQ